MSELEIKLNELFKKCKGRLVRATFDTSGGDIVFQIKHSMIVNEFGQYGGLGFKLVPIDNTFKSFGIFNNLFNGKIKEIAAFPLGKYYTNKEFENKGYKCIYDDGEFIRQDIIGDIEYYFYVPYSFEINSLNGVEVNDVDDKDEPYVVKVVNGVESFEIDIDGETYTIISVNDDED